MHGGEGGEHQQRELHRVIWGWLGEEEERKASYEEAQEEAGEEEEKGRMGFERFFQPERCNMYIK